MKKFLSIILMSVALAMAAAPSNQATGNVVVDSTEVKQSGDTTTAAGAAAAVGEAVNEVLDDTVYVDERGRESHNDPEVDVMFEGMQLARFITLFTIAGVVFITFVSLLFYYLNRRRRYKMIEKAIENGYPLPPELMGGHAVQQHNIYVTPPAQHAAQPMPRQPQAGGTIPAPVPQGIPVGQPLTQWQTYRGGIITSIVGFSLMLFFLAADATPMVALMSIILFIGLAKLFFTYQEQRNISNIYTNVTQPQAPTRPQAPAQPTPPPFRQEEPKCQSQPETPQSPEQPS